MKSDALDGDRAPIRGWPVMTPRARARMPGEVITGVVMGTTLRGGCDKSRYPNPGLFITAHCRHRLRINDPWGRGVPLSGSLIQLDRPGTGLRPQCGVHVGRQEHSQRTHPIVGHEDRRQPTVGQCPHQIHRIVAQYDTLFGRDD